MIDEERYKLTNHLFAMAVLQNRIDFPLPDG
jgi:hypothetical protein